MGRSRDRPTTENVSPSIRRGRIEIPPVYLCIGETILIAAAHACVRVVHEAVVVVIWRGPGAPVVAAYGERRIPEVGG